MIFNQKGILKQRFKFLPNGMFLNLMLRNIYLNDF